METLQLYRSRLAGSEKALQLVQDLNRGRATKTKGSRRAVRGAGKVGVSPRGGLARTETLCTLNGESSADDTLATFEPLPRRQSRDMSELNGELWRDIYYASFDDLRLHVRHYPVADAKARPVVCLPGLTRNGRDFHYLASYLSHHPQRPRDVYCVDYRGRGGSQYDRHWRNYTPFIELIDALDFMTIQDLHQAAIIGTSRGGIIAMMMAAVRPTAMGVVVLNDIGPVIETMGLARIMGYVGRTKVPRSWDDAALLLREMNERAFPAIESWQWEEMARAVFNERMGGRRKATTGGSRAPSAASI